MVQPSVTSITHDTVDLDQAVAFWAELLGLEVVHLEGPYAHLGKLGEDGPLLAFQQVPELKDTKNRLHMDIHVEDRTAFGHKVVEMGGSIIGDHQEGNFPTWIVMADPEGNEFCIYDSSEPTST